MKPPPFDANAKLHAKGLAVSYGKPKARAEGLKALHAVMHVNSADAAQQHFGVSRQRFSEWKQIVNAAKSAQPPSQQQQRLAAAFEQTALLVSDEWVRANLQMLASLRVGEPCLSADGFHATRTLHAQLCWDESKPFVQDTTITYECAPEGETSAVDALARRKRNRHSEEAALRKLDVLASAEHVVAKRQRKRKLRADEQHTAERERVKQVRLWLDSILEYILSLICVDSYAAGYCILSHVSSLS